MYVIDFMRPKAAESESRRRIAPALLQDGTQLAEIAQLVGVSVSSVKRWKRAWKEGGEEALAAKHHHGPPEKLSDDQMHRKFFDRCSPTMTHSTSYPICWIKDGGRLTIWEH